jgi:hypothetical protein
MKNLVIKLTTLCAALFILASCQKKNEAAIESAPISDYFPLEVGKFITYRLDSTVYSGSSFATRSYQVKYMVDAKITDNLNRPAFRIVRYIRDTAGRLPWRSDATFMAIDHDDAGEFIENNLRFVKLRLPFRNEFAWKGNTFIDTYSSLSTVRYLDDWNYTYEEVEAPYSINGKQFANTVTVNQNDETLSSAFYEDKNIGKEVYAKGVGLVYKFFLHYQFQTPANGSSFYNDGSYGIKLSLLEHN